MKRIIKYISLLLLLFLPWQGWSQEVQVSAKLDTNIMLIGDQTVLHLQMVQPKNKTVYWPEISDTIGHGVDLIKMSVPDTQLVDKSTIKVSRNLLITSFDTGYVAIPPLTFKYDMKNDSVFSSAQTKALLLAVVPLKVDMKKGIADIKPIIKEPFSWIELEPYIIALLILIVVVLVGIYIYKRIKNKKPIFSLPKKPAVPAHIKAISQLDKLKEKKLWQNGNAKAYYSELTDIIRDYMGARFNFNAKEMITTDIVDTLEQKIDKGLLEESKKVLELADFVKFAKIQPLADENSQALKWAYDFVEITKPQMENSEKREEETL